MPQTGFDSFRFSEINLNYKPVVVVVLTIIFNRHQPADIETWQHSWEHRCAQVEPVAFTQNLTSTLDTV